jgi:hypothetical protein
MSVMVLNLLITLTSTVPPGRSSRINPSAASARRSHNIGQGSAVATDYIEGFFWEVGQIRNVLLHEPFDLTGKPRLGDSLPGDLKLSAGKIKNGDGRT